MTDHEDDMSCQVVASFDKFDLPLGRWPRYGWLPCQNWAGSCSAPLELDSFMRRF